jgi:hypothetical protein
MASVRSHSEPSDVDLEQGQVIVDGPDAAKETGRRMIDAAGQVRGHPHVPDAPKAKPKRRAAR